MKIHKRTELRYAKERSEEWPIKDILPIEIGHEMRMLWGQEVTVRFYVKGKYDQVFDRVYFGVIF